MGENMETRNIKESDFKFILENDKRIYPTDSPVKKDVIKSWYIRNPEFGIIFKKDGKIIGNFIGIPLNKQSWEKLINGELKESEITDKTIFNILKDNELCIHCYHLEKFDDLLKDFYKICLEKLKEIIVKLQKENPKLQVLGFSGLAVSPSGIGLFENKFKCKEIKFLCQEYVLEKRSQKFVAKSKEEADERQKQGWKILNRCKMLVLYPNEESLVWDILNTH
jgi:hypothetical protein